MSRNNIKFATILFVSLVYAINANNLKSKDGFFEDTYIVKALLAKEHRDLKTSSQIFTYLYDKTGKYEYLIQALADAGDSGKISDELLNRAEHFIIDKHTKKQKEFIATFLAKIYALRGNIKKSDEIIKKYLSNTNNKEILKALYKIYMQQKRYEDAYKILKKRYSSPPTEYEIMDEAEFLYDTLGKKSEAKKLLETYINMHKDKDTDPNIYLKLIDFYIQDKDINNILRVYEKLYNRYPKKFILKKIIKLYLYKKDINGLISFLKKHEKGNEELLYMIYREKRDIKNALKTADKLYKSTKKPKWLAQKAMLMYEEAKKNQKITPQFLKKFSEYFDKAIKEGADDSIYLNYYGYTLIEHNLDIKRGIKLVKKALKQKPNSYYYLDSLAWGLYKEGKCNEAKRIMEKVTKLGGLKESEIKEHKIKIDECANKKDK